MAGTDATTVTNSSGDQFRLKYADDFSAGALDNSLWGYPFGGGVYWNGAFSWGRNDVNVVNGQMIVSSTWHPEGYWTVGGINMLSAGNAITYGRVEFDAKVDKGQGTGTAILMWPTTNDHWPPEIDLIETPHGNRDQITFTNHWQGPGGNNDNQYQGYDIAVDASQWHHYMLDWTPTKLDFYIDGQLVLHVTDHIPDEAMSFGAMGYVAADYEGWYGGGPDATTPAQVNTYLDNIRIYQWLGTEALPAPPPPPPAPLNLEAGSGADVLVLRISQDAWRGNAQYTVSVDGVQVGGSFTASALHSSGQSDTLTLRGDWGPGTHTVTVNFLNDAWGGTADTDRNLYVDAISLNGQDMTGGTADLMIGGPVDFAVAIPAAPTPKPEPLPLPADPVPPATDPAPGTSGPTDWDVLVALVMANYAATGRWYIPPSWSTPTPPAPPPPPPPAPLNLEAGSGADVLVLKISQDAWQGDARYTVSVDGVQVGGSFTANAWHAAGQSDTLTLRGDWGPGTHTVTVNFLNDAWGGNAGTDRNLYLDSASYNGMELGSAQAIYSNWQPGRFGFTEPGADAGDLPPVRFGTPGGGWDQAGKVRVGHLDHAGTDYLTFSGIPAWGTLSVQLPAGGWQPGHATHLAFENFLRTELDFASAGGTGIDLLLSGARSGHVTLGDGDDTLIWVAHSAGGRDSERMVIRTGDGNDTVRITAAGLTALDDAGMNGKLYNTGYDGRLSIAEVHLGAGQDSITTEGMVKLVAYGGAGFATIRGGASDDVIQAGTGGGRFAGGPGKDSFVFERGDGHVVIEDFASRTDKLKFLGLSAADIHTEQATEDGIAGLLVTYDAQGDSIFLAHVTRLAHGDMIFA